MPAVAVRWTKADILKRFLKYGGISRTLFSDPSDVRVEKQLGDALDLVAELFPRISSSFAAGHLSPLPMTSSMVLHYNVMLPSLGVAAGLPQNCFELDEAAPLVWASEYVTTRLARIGTESGGGALRMLLSSLGKLQLSLPGADGFRGNVFEGHGHLVLYANKTSYLRRKVTWRTVTHQGGAGWQMQQTHVGQPEGVKNFTVQGDLRYISTHRDIALLTPHQLGQCSRTFGVVDLVLHSHYVFQLTSGAAHDVSWTQLVELEQAMRPLLARPWHLAPRLIKFYFVVPPDRFRSFRIGGWLWPSAVANAAGASQPTRDVVNTLLARFEFGVLQLYEVRVSETQLLGECATRPLATCSQLSWSWMAFVFRTLPSNGIRL